MIFLMIKNKNKMYQKIIYKPKILDKLNKRLNKKIEIGNDLIEPLRMLRKKRLQILLGRDIPFIEAKNKRITK